MQLAFKASQTPKISFSLLAQTAHRAFTAALCQYADQKTPLAPHFRVPLPVSFNSAFKVHGAPVGFRAGRANRVTAPFKPVPLQAKDPDRRSKLCRVSPVWSLWGSFTPCHRPVFARPCEIVLEHDALPEERGMVQTSLAFERAGSISDAPSRTSRYAGSPPPLEILGVLPAHHHRKRVS